MLVTAGIAEWTPAAHAQAAPPDPLVTDGDYDGVVDAQDNCPNLWNPDQQDTDGDGRGDRCDVDVVSGPVVHPFNGNTYLLLSPASWEVSEAAAVRFGGHLVTVNDAAEQAWLVETFGALADRMWIGLRDVGGPYPKLTLAMRWEWVDGSTSDYRGFRPGEPDAVFYYYDDWELGQWAWSNSQEYAALVSG